MPRASRGHSLNVIQCQLPLSEIYLKVRFAPDKGETPVPPEQANP